MGWPDGSGEVMPSGSKQISVGLVCIEEEPVMSEPVLETTGAQSQLCEAVITSRYELD